MNIYVMYDKKAEAAVRIFLFKNDDLAMRFLKNAIEMPNSPFLLNLEDMELLCVGSWDDDKKMVLAGGCYNDSDVVSAFDEYVNDFLFKNKKGVNNVKEFRKDKV